MIYLNLKYILLLVIVLNESTRECITKNVNQDNKDNLHLKFVFIVSILIILIYLVLFLQYNYGLTQEKVFMYK